MYIHETEFRVRYGETDKMGFVYYGNYPEYYEVGRVELMRSLGVDYAKCEEDGIIMPVLSLNIKYIKPGFYDDVLTLRTTLKNVSSFRITFYYEMSNSKGELINIGNTDLAFLDAETKKPKAAPLEIVDAYNKHSEAESK